ncbi:MAG: hypothetical protein GY750_12390 [Lentisphaerae bacterium]|nr:hypothetical protein [Lentisphaerota bacterium]MCP4102213.1 hypothetical protein [Lentisphaerota bacterium]
MSKKVKLKIFYFLSQLLQQALFAVFLYLYKNKSSSGRQHVIKFVRKCLSLRKKNKINIIGEIRNCCKGYGRLSNNSSSNEFSRIRVFARCGILTNYIKEQKLTRLTIPKVQHQKNLKN